MDVLIYLDFGRRCAIDVVLDSSVDDDDDDDDDDDADDDDDHDGNDDMQVKIQSNGEI